MLTEAPERVTGAWAKQEYKAFDAPTADRQEGFVIQTRNYGSIMPSYGVFFQANFDDDGLNMVLLFAHQLVKLRGELLYEMGEPLRLKTLQVMREFDGRKHHPAEPGGCLITGVEVFSKTPAREAEQP